MTDNPWVWIAGIAGTLLSSAGVVEIIRRVLDRRPKPERRATVEISLSKQTLEYAQQLEEDAAAARKTAADAWSIADVAQQKVVAVNLKMDETIERMGVMQHNFGRLLRWSLWVVSAIHERGMTVERLRSMVDSEPPPIDKPNG